MPVVIVTGASKGIGAAIIDVILRDKSNKVVAVARSEEPLRNLRIKYGEERVATLVGDLGNVEISSQIVDLALEKFGQIDSMIANAGVLDPVDRIELAEIAKWKQLFDVNFFSIVALVASAIPHLRKTKGKVVIVSSGASTKGYYGWGAYGASKAAVNHFVSQLVSEEKDISAIAVAPGVVDTEMQSDIRDKFGSHMTAESLKRFTDLKSNHELLEPIVPATIYANLATRGFSSDLNGQYLRYNDALLDSYSV